MNILLINPPFKGRFSRTSRSPGKARGGTIYYPIWLAYAAGVLERNEFGVDLIDACAEERGVADIIEEAKQSSPRLIVLDTSTPSIGNDIDVAEAIKDNLPGSFIVLVGTHVSALPEETLRLSTRVDAIARREYEYTLLDLARALEKGHSPDSVPGLSWRSGEEIIHNPDRPYIENLDELPFVSRVYKNHLKVENYFFAAARHPMVMTISGRGCPNRCTFCVYPQTFHGRRYRMRSPENVVDEFEWIKSHLPQVKEVGIEDDTFTAKRSRTREICELLIKRKNKLRWYCNVRPDVDLETLILMKRAGCRLVTTGFESGSQIMLDRMHKGLDLDRIRQFMADARKARMLVHGCVILGIPGETGETIRQSIAFAHELNCDSMQFYPLYVYPGTEAFREASEKGCLTTTDYSKWVTEDGYHNCVVSLPGLAADDLLRTCNNALRAYHFRPAYLWMKLRQSVRDPGEGLRSVRAALSYVLSLGKDLKKKNTASKKRPLPVSAIDRKGLP
jgi:anaerobic magnesium-protoporphyrin IX monomethyl ester cyclase